MIKKLYIIIVSVISAIGGLLFGFDTGVISGAQPFLQHPDGWAVSDHMLEIITTSVLIGASIGCIISGRISDYIGRKKIIIVISFIFAFGALATGAAANPIQLIIGRFIIGIAIGISSFVVPLYISELSPARYRGRLVSLNQLMITIGIVVSYLVDLYFADEKNPYSWRNMFYAGVVPAIVLLGGMIFLPESPRWLFFKRRIEKAKKILSRIEEKNTVDQTLKDLEEEILIEKEQTSWFKEIFKPTMRRPLMVGTVIFIIQQFVGINTVIYYSPKIFLLAGMSGSKAAITAAVIVGVFNVFFTIVSLFLIDRLGRRPLYFIGLSGILVSLIILSISFFYQESLGEWLKWFAVGGTLIYISFFALSLGPLGWLINSEIFPLRIRGLGISIGALSHWVFNALVSFTFLKLAWAFTTSGKELVDASGITGPNPAGAFLLYALVAIGGIIWGYYYIPETKGKSLEEIEKELCK